MNCNNYFDMTDQGDSFASWQGLRGPAGPQGTPGAPGSSVELKGPVATTGDLPAIAPASELWQVGTQAPYNGYFFNGEAWISLGPVAAGTTFTPTVSSDGVISWTNDGGLPNPESVNIKGPQGPAGADGSDGVTFTPAVSSAGVISWTNDGSLPNPEPVNIKGPQGQTGPAGPGVPSGGSTGQVLKKQSATDYDTAWETEDLGINGASVGDLVRINAVDANGKPTTFGRISDPNNNIAITQNTNTATQNISEGQYVIWHGALYTASAAIASGATLSSSNLTAVSNGGVNSLRNTLLNLIGYIDVDLSGIAVTNADSGWYYASKNIASKLPPYSLAFAVVEGTSFDADVFYSITSNDAIRIKSATSKTLGNRAARVFYYLYGGF